MKVYLVTSLWVNDGEVFSGADVFATREAALEFLDKSIKNELLFWREDLDFNLPTNAGKEGLSCYQINWNDNTEETIREIDADDPWLHSDITIDRTPTSFCISRVGDMMWAEYHYEEKEVRQ